MASAASIPSIIPALPATAPVAGVLCLWTGFILVSRYGGAGAMTPWDIIAVRYAVAGATLLAWWRMRGPLGLTDPRTLALAAIGGLGYALFAFNGFARAPAAHAGILLPGTMPFLAALWAWLLGGGIPDRRSWPGYAAIAAGVGCLAANLAACPGSWAGDACFVAASVLWTLYAALLRRWNRDPLATTTAISVITALAYLPVWWLLLPSRLDQASPGAIALQAGYQGVLAAVVQMLLFATAIARIGPRRMGALMALVPAAAALLAVPLLGEPLTLPVILALALVGAGTVVVNHTTN